MLETGLLDSCRLLPAEIWLVIFQYAPQSLYNIALVSSTFYDFANPLLYQSIELKKVGSIFRLFTILVKRRPDFVEYIVKLRLKFRDIGTDGSVFLSSYKILQKVLEMEQIRNLKLLHIDLYLAPVKSHNILPIPRRKDLPLGVGSAPESTTSDGSFLQLNAFATDIDCDASLAKFLHSQNMIKKLSLTGTPDNDFGEYIYSYSRLSSQFLPALATLECEPDFVAPLTYGRPVTSVELSLLEPESIALESLRNSSAPNGVSQLILFLPRSRSPSSLLQRVAMGAPRLVQLIIYFDMGCIFDEVSTGNQTQFLTVLNVRI
jgi:hypothetical protein